MTKAELQKENENLKKALEHILNIAKDERNIKEERFVWESIGRIKTVVNFSLEGKFY